MQDVISARKILPGSRQILQISAAASDDFGKGHENSMRAPTEADALGFARQA
jgi:hypothetical protein